MKERNLPKYREKETIITLSTLAVLWSCIYMHRWCISESLTDNRPLHSEWRAPHTKACCSTHTETPNPSQNLYEYDCRCIIQLSPYCRPREDGNYNWLKIATCMVALKWHNLLIAISTSGDGNEVGVSFDRSSLSSEISLSNGYCTATTS